MSNTPLLITFRKYGQGRGKLQTGKLQTSEKLRISNLKPETLRVATSGEQAQFLILAERQTIAHKTGVMDVAHKLKLFVVGMMAFSPLLVGAQTTDSTGSSLIISGGTISLGAFPPVTPVAIGGLSNSLPTGTSGILPDGSILLTPGNLGVVVDSFGGGGNPGIAPGSLSGLSLNLGGPFTIAPTTNNYSFGTGTTQRGGLTLDQLHGALSGGLGAMNMDNFPNSEAGNQGLSASQISVVPEPGVVALLVLGGLGFAARFRAKRR